MEKNIYPIGFWNVLPATQPGLDCVKDWEDLGCTLTMTGWYGSSNEDVEGMLDILDRSEKKNIKVIFTDNRLDFRYLHSGNYLEILKKDVELFGNHPAVYGFFLGDEPGPSEMDDVAECIRLFKELCPDKEPFLNLLPWVPDLNNAGLIASSQENYKEKLIDYVKKTGVKILSYDCYMQMCESSKEVLDPTALDSYYYNLKIFEEAARETGAELWYTTLAVGHGMYRCPTQDDFRWEINTAVAHGVKSLFYWYLYADSYNFNYRLHPVDMLFERTDTFRYVSTENRIFQQVYGPTFSKLQLEKVYHAIKSYGGFPLLDENSDNHIKSVITNTGDPVIVSKFRNPDKPNCSYYAIVNNSQRNSVCANITYDGGDFYEVRSHADGPHHALKNHRRFSSNGINQYLAPGQMIVLVFED